MKLYSYPKLIEAQDDLEETVFTLEAYDSYMTLKIDYTLRAKDWPAISLAITEAIAEALKNPALKEAQCVV